MKTIYLILLALVFCLNTTLAEEKPKNPIPPIGTGEDFVGATYNPQTNYGTKWSFGLSQLEPLYCHFSFDLVAKDGSKTYSFSKYFAVKTAYQRNFYHEERIIDRDTDIGTFSTEINEEYQELVNSSRF